MKTNTTQPGSTGTEKSFDTFLNEYESTLDKHLSDYDTFGWTDPSESRSREALEAIRDQNPLSAFVPRNFGGRGNRPQEGLSVLEATAYHSLPLALYMGINGVLFLQPLTRYGNESVAGRVVPEFLQDNVMGGLMMTEPEYGTDALHMETSFVEEEDEYHLRGTKHWAGLSGWADYWLIAARHRKNDRSLGRDVQLFVCEGQDGGVNLVDRYPNLGLCFIPYGRSEIDTRVPVERKLEPRSTGIRMLQDLLHRSRFQFTGIGLGFTRRLLDEALEHTENRTIRGRQLDDFDQVQRRLSDIQSASTISAAMCKFSTEILRKDEDLAKELLPANTMKAYVTDLMQSCSRSLLQLKGAQGYRRDTVAGTGMVDSRAFQIFEGSNDVLYDQIGRAVRKKMRRFNLSSLSDFLGEYDITENIASDFRSLLNIEIDEDIPQRQFVRLGKIMSRLFCYGLVDDLGESGFRARAIERTKSFLGDEVRKFTEVLKHYEPTGAVRTSIAGDQWRQHVV